MRRGYRPSRGEAIRAFCCECMGNYADGKQDCEHVRCPLYSKHKFRKLKPDLSWFFGPWSNHEIQRNAMGATQEKYLIYKLGSSLRVGYPQICKAKCYECCGNFVGGMPRDDCGITECPIYYWMPYRTGLPTFNWMFDLAYTNRHLQRAIVAGLVKETKYSRVVDRDRYIQAVLPWTGEPQGKRIRRIII